jgi:hypothetical protein
MGKTLKKQAEALLIMHLSSLDCYFDIYGAKKADQMAEKLIEAMSFHNGPVIVVDELWEIGIRHDSEAREKIYELALFPMLEQGTAILIAHDEGWESDFSWQGKPLSECVDEEMGYTGYWPELFQELLPVLNELNINRIRIGGFWYDPGYNHGCALAAGRYLSRMFDVKYDEKILGRAYSKKR